MKKKRIIFIIPSLDAGGIETYLLRFLRFVEKDIDPIILVRNNNVGVLEKDYRRITENIFFKPLRYLNPFNLYWYYRFFKNQKPEVVVDFNANFAGFPIWIASLVKIAKRMVFYRQGSNHYPTGWLKNRYNAFVNNLVYNQATHILSNSKAALNFFFPFCWEKDTRFQVLYNGLNTSQYIGPWNQIEIKKKYGLSAQTFLIGHSGRKDPAKNHELIFKLAHQAKNDGLNCHFVCFGLGTETFLDKLSKLQLLDKVTCLGYQTNVPELLGMLDLFIFPSKTEGQPNALIEAMATGLPILASDIPSIRECVPKILHNSLIKPDDVESFYLTIKEFINQPKRSSEEVISFINQNFDATTNFKIFKNLIGETSM